MKRNRIISKSLFTFMIVFVLLSSVVTNRDLWGFTEKNDSTSDNLKENPINVDDMTDLVQLDDELNNHILDGEEFTENAPNLAVGEDIKSWWNETYESRIEITIEEPGIADRVNEPISIWHTFDLATHHRNSTRIVKYEDESTQTEVISQVWNITTNGDNDEFLTTATISFLADVLEGSTSTYFLYYTSQMVENVTAKYLGLSSLTSTISLANEGELNEYIQAVQIENGEFIVSLNHSAGFSTFETDGKNFHTNDSMTPAPESSITTGLIGHWDFNDGSGSIAEDKTGNGNDGTLVGNPTWVTGKEGTALDFSGSQYVSAPITRGDTVTFSMWATWDPGQTNDMLFLAGPAGSGGGPDLFCENSGGTGRVAWNIWDSWNNPFGTMPASSSDGEFHHFVVVAEAGTGNTKLFYDGTLLGTANYVDPSKSGSTIFQIGGSANYYWVGMIDEVRMYDRALSSDEVSDLYEFTSGTIIDNISIIQEGPVFSQYGIDWTKKGDMRSSDVVTVYNDLSRYAIDRTFHWEDKRTVGNNSWQLLDTSYDGNQIYGTTYHRFHYDFNDTPLYTASSPFAANNYTILRGPTTVSGDWASVGVYITGYEKGNDLIDFSYLEWEGTAASNKFHFIPGNKSDLENYGPVLPQSDDTLTFTMWESLQIGDVYGSDYATATSNFNKTFTALKSPVSVTQSSPENLFFNLEVFLYDADDNPAPNVNVTLYNTTGNWGPLQYPAITTQQSDGTGRVYFTELYEMNISCLISYTNPYRPDTPTVNLTWFNVTLNTTQTQHIYNLNLTTLDLTLYKYEEGVGVDYQFEPVVAANVSLFWNSTETQGGPGEYIGYQTSDLSGQVQFYYLNASSAENYTVKVTLYDEFKRLNNTIVASANDAELQINFTLASYLSQSISVQVQDIITELTQYPDSPIFTPYWGQNLAVNYSYSYGPSAEDQSPITGATVLYQMKKVSTGQVFKTGSLAVNGTPGYYTLAFNTADVSYQLDTDETFQIIITAAKSGFYPQETTFSLQVQPITTDLIVEPSTLEPYWLEEFTIRAYYNDTLNNVPIEGASLTISEDLLNVDMVEEGLGWYNYTFNTSVDFASIGGYSLEVNALKTNYSPAGETIDITIQAIQTNLTYISPTMVYWGDNITVSLNYTDVHSLDLPILGATTYYVVVGDITFNEYDIEETPTPGIYNFTVNSSSLGVAGIKTFQVVAAKDNYVTNQIWINVNVSIVPTIFETNATNDVINLYWYEHFTIQTNYTDIRSVPYQEITNGVVAYSVTGPNEYSTAGTFDHLGGSLYGLEFNSINFGATGTYTFVIGASKNQFESGNAIITVNILEIEVALTSNHVDDKIEKELNEVFTLSVNLINTTYGGNVPIQDATVEYFVSGPDDFSGSGFLSSVGGGVYDLAFHTTDDFTGGSGTFTFQITATKSQHETTTLTVTVNIAINPTDLTSPYPGNEIAVLWKDNFTISVNYIDVGENQNLTGATVFYNATGPSGFKSSGILIYQNGAYELEFNTTDFNKAGTYSFQISANLSTYESQTLAITVDILVISTTLTAPNTVISIGWEEEFSIIADFTDVNNSLPISDGTVTYSISGPGISETGLILSPQGTIDGRYFEHFVSDEYFSQAGTYTFTITASQNQYETQSISITVNIAIIETELIVSSTDINLAWGEDALISLYYGVDGGTAITTGATISYSVTGPNSFSKTGEIYHISDGNYNQIFNSETFFGNNGTYTFQITAIRDQYETQQSSITVNIEVIPTMLDAIDDQISVSYGALFNISVFYEDLDSNINITSGATLSYQLTGPESYADSGFLNNFGTEIYTKEFDSASLSNGTYTFQITASKDEYQTQQIVITVDIGIVPVEFTTNASDVTIYWEESFTISTTVLNITNPNSPLPIIDMLVEYTVKGASSSFTSSGNLTHISDGVYESSFSSLSFGEAGTYTFTINATKDQYAERQLIITVTILQIPTYLTTDYPDDTVNLYWEDTIALTVEFGQDILGAQSGITTGATVSYYSPALSIPSGVLTHTSNGEYEFALDSVDFNEAGTYTFKITALKDQYLSQILVLTIAVDIVPTTVVTAQTNYTITWGDTVTFMVDYDNVVTGSPSGITDGVVEYEVGQQFGFNGDFVHTGEGTYAVTLNSLDFNGIGSYTIYGECAKSQYETQIQTFYLVINPVQTKINDTFFKQQIESVFVGTEHTYDFNFTTSETPSEGITGATIAYYEWENILTGASGTQSLIELENGLYRLNFNTETKMISNYTIAVYLGKTNYITRSAVLSLEIAPRIVSKILAEDIQTGIAEKSEGSTIVLEIQLSDPIDGTPLTGADVSMYYRNKTIVLTETATPGVYRYEISTDSEEYNALVATKTDVAIVTVTKANYTLDPFRITISVTPPEFMFGDVGIPRIFVYIGGGVALLAIAIVGTVSYVKYANIPEIVKKIEKTKKMIAGNKVIDDGNITKTKKEEIVEKFASYWELLDLDLSSILGLDKSTTSEEDSITSSDQTIGGL